MPLRRALVDLDGVLVPFPEGACEFHGHPNPYKPGEQGPWDIAKALGLSGQAFWRPLGRDFWAELGIYDHALDLLGSIEHCFGEENVCILTSPPLTTGAIEGKIAWINTSPWT